MDPSYLRDWQLATVLHIPPGAADELSAVRLDWLLQIDASVKNVTARRQPQ